MNNMQAEQQFVKEWKQALAGDREVRAQWQSEEGGKWDWQADGLSLRNSGTEWAALALQRSNVFTLSALKNFIVEVTISGKAEAAGLSFGPYKDFLADLDSSMGNRHLQLEVDAASGCWSFRVEGQLMTRHWWDSAVRTTDDLVNGALTLKARRAEQVFFQNLAVQTFQSSCQLSVIITCYRFLQRLRVSLRNWCHQDLPSGAYEVLVVNPNSPDGTHEYLAAVARCYPHVRLREVPVNANLAMNKGVMINRGIQASHGKWIWLTDADCLFSPNCAASVMRQIREREKFLFYGQRRYLTTAQTEALLTGRIDGLHSFEAISKCAQERTPENAPWGYTQIVPRPVFQRVRYQENLNHFAHSDGQFLADCKRMGLIPKQLEGLVCLHLDHPFAWYGTNTFL